MHHGRDIPLWTRHNTNDSQKLFRHTGIIITQNCGNVNSDANFGIYIQYLQKPWTFFYLCTLVNSDYGLLFVVTI